MPLKANNCRHACCSARVIRSVAAPWAVAAARAVTDLTLSSFRGGPRYPPALWFIYTYRFRFAGREQLYRNQVIDLFLIAAMLARGQESAEHQSCFYYRLFCLFHSSGHSRYFIR